MPAKRASDPLVMLPLRIPRSFRELIEREAKALGINMSDVMRARLNDPSAPPLGLPVRRRRTRSPAALGTVSKADPKLMRQLAAIGSNLNQLARAVNKGAITGHSLDAASVLVVLLAAEHELARIATDHGSEPH
jgi:hypothetical protein